MKSSDSLSETEPQIPCDSSLDPKVSVYIPTKNRLDLLKRAVSSVRTQIYTNLEIIIVDDASNDGTGKYLSAVALIDSRVRVLKNVVSMGAPVSRNRAIKSAEGLFVTGLDDDDWFAPERIETFVNHWRLNNCNNRISALYSQDRFVSKNESFTTTKPKSASYEDMFSKNQVGSQIFSLKQNFIDAGLFDPSFPAWQDLEFFLRFLRIHGPAELIDRPTYMYDATPRSDRISQDSKKVRLACHRCIDKHSSEIPGAKIDLLMQMLVLYNLRPTRSEFLWILRGPNAYKNIKLLIQKAIMRNLKYVSSALAPIITKKQ